MCIVCCIVDVSESAKALSKRRARVFSEVFRPAHEGYETAIVQAQKSNLMSEMKSIN